MKKIVNSESWFYSDNFIKQGFAIWGRLILAQVFLTAAFAVIWCMFAIGWWLVVK